MGVKAPRILIAAAGSGCGKTTITCGLLKAWKDQKLACRSWKCGPDYIDPMFHKEALAIEGGNLDSFFLDGPSLNRMIGEESRGRELTVIEGVMGYYDGMGGDSTWASTYEVASLTDTPVILILDGKGMSLSLMAVLKGFLSYKSDHGIKGVILNRTSPIVGERLKPLIEAEGIAYLGAVPLKKNMNLESRHLGLLMPGEQREAEEKLEYMAELLRNHVDLNKIYEIAKEASDIDWEDHPKEQGRGSIGKRETVRIAVAEDEAFCFYYQENRKLLKDMGAQLISFSPLRDREMPPAQGLILGGGYPELYGKELSEQTRMRESIKRFVREGGPVLAECGGFLYLHEEMEDSQGVFWPMAAAIEGRAYRPPKQHRFGYVSLEAAGEDGLLKGTIKGHEFHYWESTNCGRSWIARKPKGERRWECMHSKGGQVMGFAHLYYPSNEEFLERWLKLCRKKR